jgi:hypothetical protein
MAHSAQSRWACCFLALQQHRQLRHVGRDLAQFRDCELTRLLSRGSLPRYRGVTVIRYLNVPGFRGRPLQSGGFGPRSDLTNRPGPSNSFSTDNQLIQRDCFCNSSGSLATLGTIRLGRLRRKAGPVIFDMMNPDLTTPLTPDELAALREVAKGQRQGVISAEQRERLIGLGLIAERLGVLGITNAGRMRLAADR